MIFTRNLLDIGRIFYGITVAGNGLLTIYYHDFPYWLLPAKHNWIPVPVIYISGALLVLAGACMIFKRITRTVSLLTGAILLLIFCFYFIPYQFMDSSRYMHLSQWENAEKELSFASGAVILAGCFSENKETIFNRLSKKLILFGSILFCIPVISFGILHYLYAKNVADYVTPWMPYHLFWVYLCGTALIASGLAIILKIMPRLAAILLGVMIFIWFSILHMPRIAASPAAYLGSEITSAFLALTYSGIAFVIAGATKKRV